MQLSEPSPAGKYNDTQKMQEILQAMVRVDILESLMEEDPLVREQHIFAAQRMCEALSFPLLRSADEIYDSMVNEVKELVSRANQLGHEASKDG